MQITPKQANHLIRNRRAIYPKMYNNKPIPHEILWEILENANWAPTHRRTEPWRFQVFTDAAKTRLGQFLADAYKKLTPPDKFKPTKYEKTKKKAAKAYCMIVICMKRDERKSVPEIEETNAVACAVQNIWLSASAYGIGTYWSSPAIVYTQEMNEFLGLGTEDRCLGLLYMGYHDMPHIPGKRQPIKDKIKWIEV